MPALSPTTVHVRSPEAPAAARTLRHLLGGLRHGHLELQWPDGSHSQFGSEAPGASAAMRIADWRVCSAVLRSGDIGLAESYIAGDWSTPDLCALLTLFVRNREAIDEALYGRWWGALLYRARRLLQRNTRRGSRNNIHAHYDLGNPFYLLWLDETMNYSAALFDGDPVRSLPDAQEAKLRRALDECRLEPGQRLLEIGCGWGALAEQAARCGAHVTGVTLSQEQLAYARARLDTSGVADRADLRLQDYRDIDDAPFDAIVSIEMFEAVGHAYWGNFFATVRGRLKPGGRACIQTITIRDDLFERYVRGTDFIQQYIFPGGLLPSPSQFRAHAAAAGLEVVNELAFGGDYARTLRLWRERFNAQETAVSALGFDPRFIRTWDFYLAYCEAAFAGGSTDVIQFTLRRT